MCDADMGADGWKAPWQMSEMRLEECGVQEGEAMSAMKALPADLKPCPFCGSGRVFLIEYEAAVFGSRYKVMCADCTAQVDKGKWQSPGYAVEAWNRRTNDGD